MLARYRVGLVTASIWATLAVNVLGSLLLGALSHLGRDIPPVALQALGIGFLGGFTTFSTFSVQALLTAEGGRPSTAALYCRGIRGTRPGRRDGGLHGEPSPGPLERSPGRGAA